MCSSHGLCRRVDARVAAATEAAVAAASTSRATSGPSGGETSGKGTDWFKVLPLQPDAEDEIKQFRDWAWTMETYLTCVDENYRDELKTIHTHLDRECPMSSMVEATQDPFQTAMDMRRGDSFMPVCSPRQRHVV